MPGTTLPFAPHHIPAAPTKEELEWADLPIIDLSKARTPEGRAALAPQVRDAMHNIGFLCVINHGWTQTQRDRMFDIADVMFSQVSEEEKRQHTAKIAEEGSKRGYKPRQLWTLDNEVRDQHEHYVMHRSIHGQEHPKAVEPFLPELRAFSEYNHHNILHTLLQLLALGMELPEDTFVNIHNFDGTGEAHVRFIKYYPRSLEEEIKTKNVWAKGHTDMGTVTILWSQPVSGLQMKSPDGKWRWIKHIDNGLVINVGDTMEMLSGGFYKGTIHRVIQPAMDQRGMPRLGVFYFGMTDDDVRLVPFAESPVFKHVEIQRKVDDSDALTMSEWRKGRAMSYGLKETKQAVDDSLEEQMVNGIVMKHYN